MNNKDILAYILIVLCLVISIYLSVNPSILLPAGYELALDGYVISRNLMIIFSLYLLSKLENFDNKSPIQIENFSIEHIMPQNKSLNESWKNALGENYKTIQKEYLHTIGNLTLTAYNSEMSDKDFIEKLNIEGGFKESALRLNRYVVKQDTWNEEKIKERAEQLYHIALQAWKYPYLSDEELSYFEKETDEENIYSINSYSFSTESKELYNKIHQITRK